MGTQLGIAVTMRAPSGAPAGTAWRLKISLHCSIVPGLEEKSPSVDVTPGWSTCHEPLQPVGLCGRGAKVTQEQQGWLCSPLQPPLCLQVQHRLMLQLAVLPALHCPRMCQATHPELRAHPHPSLSLSSISLTLLPCWSSAPLAATGALQNHAGGSSSVVSKTQPASRVHLSSQTGILLLGWFPKKHSLCHGDGDVRTYVRPSQPFRILDLLG